MGILNRISNVIKHGWNAFVNEEPTTYQNRDRNFYDLGYSTTYRPDRSRFTRGNEKSIINAVYNRIAIDCSAVQFNHIRVDEKGRFREIINSGLNNILTLEANKDQHSRNFLQDIVISMFDEGVVAVVPVDTSIDIRKGNSYSIETMRTGKILQWYPDHVEVEVYNDRKGVKEILTLPKKSVAIIENPHYSVMNERNSTLQRLIRKLNILDAIDEQSGSGKLDIIIQLPYVIKTEARRDQAEKRRKDIEDQLTGSKYGIAYTDGMEKITQLNRPVENNLQKQIEYLTSMLYSQLGISSRILDGTADEKEIINYNNHSLEPILASIKLEFDRKFISKTARTQGQTIRFFNDPFKLITLGNLADLADKLTRNEILSSNELRQKIGLMPVDDPKADELRNKNLNISKDQVLEKLNEEEGVASEEEDGEIQNG